MKERIVQFGERRRLVGTLTEPGGAAHDLAFVLLNAGVISRVGPQRLNVTLARALARQGHAVLRFDLSGLGESRAAGGTESFEQQAVLDIREAMSAMEREQGASRFVLFGLCSGSDNAYSTALMDPRVAGLLMLDPFVYSTWRSVLRARWLRLQRPGVPGALWRAARRQAVGALRRVSALTGKRPAYDPAADYDRASPSRDEFAASLGQLLDRGVAVYLMYSGSLARYYNSATQFEQVFGAALASRLDVEFQPHVNHTRTERSAQRDLVERVLSWTSRRFPERA